MSMFGAIDASASGLTAERLRMDVISNNIANANTTRTSEGGAYQRKEVVFRAIEFDKVLNEELANTTHLLPNENPLDEGFLQENANPAIMSVIVDKVVRDESEFKYKFEPSHPDANAQGYVAYPNVNPVIEMSNLVEATRAYQANVSAFQSAKSIAQSAIDILKG